MGSFPVAELVEASGESKKNESLIGRFDRLSVRTNEEKSFFLLANLLSVKARCMPVLLLLGIHL